MSRHWEVKVHDKKVVIEPPIEIDREYDDLWLSVTGNMLEEDKIEIASKIVSVLNSHYPQHSPATGNEEEDYGY